MTTKTAYYCCALDVPLRGTGDSFNLPLLGPFVSETEACAELSRAEALAHEHGPHVQRFDVLALPKSTRPRFKLHDLPLTYEERCNEWTVYRDGGRWRGQASSLLDALWRSSYHGERVQTFGHSTPLDRRMASSSTWEPDVPEPALLANAVSIYTDATTLARVFGPQQVALTRLVVAVDKLKRLRSVVTWRRLCAERARAHGNADVPRYKSGERKGRIKWPTKSTAAERLALVARHVDALEISADWHDATSLIADAGRIVFASLWSVLGVLGVRGTEALESMTDEELVGLRDRLDGLCEEFVPLAAWGQPLHGIGMDTTIDEIRKRIAKRRDLLASVRDHGFPVGSRAWLLPSKTDRDEGFTRKREVFVVGVEVDHHKSSYNPTGEPEHRRSIRWADPKDAREWETPGLRPTVDRLEAVS